MSLVWLNSLDWERVVEVEPRGAVGGGPGPDAVVDGLPEDGGAADAAAARAGRVPGQRPARPGPPGQGDVARAGVVALLQLVDDRLLHRGGGGDRSEVRRGAAGGAAAVVAAHGPRVLRPLVRQRQGAGAGERGRILLLRRHS